MIASLSRALACLCLAALAAPTSVANAAVAPPTADDGATYAAADVGTAATGDPCSSHNVIKFREATVFRFRVRHLGEIRCEPPTAIRCRARLFDLSGSSPALVSEIAGRDRKRCSMASSFGDSEQYGSGTPFRERFRYRIRLLRDDQRWAGTSEFCPKLSPNRRRLTCRDSHRTAAPVRHVVRH